MRILQINSVEGVGSTGRIASGIQEVVNKNNHTFINAYGRTSNVKTGNIKIGNNKDVLRHVILTRIFDKHGFGSKNATYKFLEEVKKMNPDVIHLQNIHGYYINIDILFNFLKDFNKPIIWSLHDCWAFTGHCSHYEYINCEKWKTGCFNCPEKNSYPKSILMDNSKINYNKKKKLFSNIQNLTLVTASKWLSTQVSHSFLNGYDKVDIKTGIDLEKFKPKVTNKKYELKIDDKFVILGVASVWSQRKGLNDIISLSKRLKDDEIIILVGVNEKQKKLLPPNILSIPRTNSIEDLAEIYNMADVFINPTLEDTYPTTNLEAQACGTPVITYNTGGSPESVPLGTGYVVEKHDINNLYSMINIIKNNGKSFYSEACLNNSLNFDMNINYQKYFELYKEKVSHFKSVGGKNV